MRQVTKRASSEYRHHQVGLPWGLLLFLADIQPAMIMGIQAMNLGIPLLPVICALMIGCTASEPPEYGYVDWFLSSTTGARLTLVVYDKVCSRTHFRVRLARSVATSINTCSDSEGMADIRYRKAGMPNNPDNPWFDTRVGANQSLLIR